jgi:hypothetical protein
MDRIANDAPNYSSIVSYVFVALLTFLQSRCLVKIRGDAYRHTDRWEGSKKYAIEMAQVPLYMYILW